MKNNTMQKYLLILCFLTVTHINGFSQSKWEFGAKISANQLTTKLLEFTDPFPFYEKDFGNNAQQFYGTTLFFVGYNIGAFTNYNILENGRIKLTSEIILNTKGYVQKALGDSPEFKISKIYLDIPISIKLQPFYKAGVFLEPGIYQAFNLSGKTNFPATNANSSEFEKRRARANARETNLFGFKIGAGYEFKKFDVLVAFQSDKQYDYVQ
jgi:hypothetical protein